MTDTHSASMSDAGYCRRRARGMSPTLRHNEPVVAVPTRVAQVVTIVGPTASGKSALSLDVAEIIGGEVINADSMQVYRGMDVGTGKLSAAERRGIAHHLLDIWEIDAPANVAQYQRLARDRIADVLSRGAVPILVGGSGLYVRAVLDDLRFPGTDPELRARLLEELELLGPLALHERLREQDSDAAAAILPTNGRRIVRALEVVALTGAFAAALPEPRDVITSVTVGLDLPRDDL
ncbi:MAG: tRNA (adenosine(37)-N6)-dimethylallyltransferase MiaA, partial [Actinobacteria bacterium]|nr:tRNA (adenosine(37)-N6)-dimethylallyltransferase MiaA [Actinomycetota bacterium]